MVVLLVLGVLVWLVPAQLPLLGSFQQVGEEVFVERAGVHCQTASEEEPLCLSVAA